MESFLGYAGNSKGFFLDIIVIFVSILEMDFIYFLLSFVYLYRRIINQFIQISFEIENISILSK